jgi:microcystin-dependent protein
MTSYNRDYWMAFGAHQKPTAGDMKFSAAQYDHLGWMKCDGSELNISDFQFLYNVIGNSFGTPSAPTKFLLPNPGGRVPGVIGTGHDSNPIYSTITLARGSTIGEYQHVLTIPEMPSHNHGVNGVNQISTNNSTSVAYTGLSVLTSTTGVYDSGHTHGYTATNVNNVDRGLAITDTPANSGASGVPTDNNSASIVDPGHIHPLNDPGHAHTLNPAGMDNYHNNIQPTIGMGNMFIYSGRPLWGSYPYTTGKNLW